MIAPLAEVIRNLFRFHKLKMVSALFFFLASLVAIFPYDDLSDLVTTQILKLTNNATYIQFERLNLQSLPQPGLRLEDVTIQQVGIPRLKAGELELRPDIASLLTFKGGAGVAARNFLGGDIDVSVSGVDLNDPKANPTTLELEISGLDLDKINKLTGSPVKLKGSLQGEANGVFDPSLKEQPEAEYNIVIDNFVMPPSTLPVMGGFSIPSVSFSNVRAKGRWVGRELIIEEASLGQSSDPMYGRIRGKMGLELISSRGSVQHRFNAYELRIELTVKAAAEKKLSLFLSFIDKFRSPVQGGGVYRLKLSGPKFGAPPNMDPLSRF
jgi:type II secretion system protein N